MRIERVVVNASPLIILFRGHLESLLPGLFSEICARQVYGYRTNWSICFWEKPEKSKHNISFASVFAPLLGPMDEAARGMILREIE